MRFSFLWLCLVSACAASVEDPRALVPIDVLGRFQGVWVSRARDEGARNWSSRTAGEGLVDVAIAPASAGLRSADLSVDLFRESPSNDCTLPTFLGAHGDLAVLVDAPCSTDCAQPCQLVDPWVGHCVLQLAGGGGVYPQPSGLELFLALRGSVSCPGVSWEADIEMNYIGSRDAS